MTRSNIDKPVKKGLRVITNFNPSPFAIFPSCGARAAQSARPFGKPNGSVVSDSLSIHGYQNIRA